jgi:hypothetical protein
MRPARPTTPKRVEQPYYAEQKTGIQKQKRYTASTSGDLLSHRCTTVAQDLTHW